MATFTPQNRASSTFSAATKNSASFAQNARHGVDIVIADIQDKTFNDTIFENDTTPIKDITFNQLSAQTWSDEPKL